MKRAVAIDAADIGGPNHGIFWPSGSSRSVRPSASRAAPQRASSAGGASRATSKAAVSTYPVGSAIASSTSSSQRTLSVAATTATSSVQSRCATWVATVQPGAGVGVSHPACVEPGDQRPEAVALGPEVVEQVVEEGHRLAFGCGGEGVVEDGGPAVEDPPAAPGVVGDRGREAEAADQVEGRLHELAHARLLLVGAEQLDGQPVGLAPDALLERRDGGEQGGVGAGRDPELERGGEHRAGEVVAEHLQHRTRTPRTLRQRPCGGRQLGAAHLGQVLDRGHHQVVLGREVVQLRAAAHPGPLGHDRGRGPAEPALDQALHRRLEQPRAHRARALLLRHPGGRHPAIVGSHQQTVKPVFFCRAE